MQRTIEAASPIRADNLGKCHIFNSFFYKRLLHCMGGRIKDRNPEEARAGYQSVKRYTPVLRVARLAYKCAQR
eukprot:5906697-Prymnesium_polylepis.1